MLRAFAALTVCVALVETARSQTVPVFVFAGQSNMVGYATDSNLLTLEQQQVLAQQPSHRRWWQLGTPDQWVNMPNATQVNTPDASGSDPRANPISSGHGFGPELAAALTISNAQGSRTVGAVKHAVNSTGLRAEGGDLDWSPSSGELYSTMVSRAVAARNAMPNGQISAFFWMQGERDSTNRDRADVYQMNLINLINTVRGAGPNGFGNTNLPIILGEIQPHPAFGDFTDTVRRAQQNIARIIPNVHLVRTDDLEYADNSVPFGNQHLSTKGTFDLGVRMGQAYLRSLNPLPAGPASMNLAVNGDFEDYAVSDWMGVGGSFSSGVTTSLTMMSPTIPPTGWIGINKGVTLVRQGAFGGDSAPASSGKQFISLQNGVFHQGDPGFGGASQTFATNNTSNSILRHYHVFFDYSAISRGPGEGSTQFTYDLSSGSESVNVTTLTVSTTGVNDLQMPAWQSASFQFNSGGASTTLRFLPRDTPDGLFYGATIDNVKVINGPIWTAGGGGNTNWDNNSNWSNNNNPNDTVGFGYKANFLWTAGLGNVTVNMNQGRGMHSLRFDSPGGYTINGAANTLDMRSTGVGNTSLLVARGNHTMNVRVNLNNVPMDVDIAAGSTLTLNGQLSSASAGLTLTKFGVGSLVLTHANNDYTGATRVVGGTLRLVNGTTNNNIRSSPSISVFRDATLDVTGLSGGGIALQPNQDLSGGGAVRGGVNATASGVNISPGNSPGIMTFSGVGNITLGTETVLDMEIGGAIDSTGSPGWSFDQIVVDGTGAPGKTLSTGGAKLNLISLPGRAYMQPYEILSAVNGAGIDFTTVLRSMSGANLVDNVPVTEGGWTYSVDYESDGITLMFIPEPSALALVLLGMAGLLQRSRR